MDTIEDFKVLPVRKDCLGERLVRPAEEWEFTFHGKYWIVRNAFRDLEQFKDILNMNILTWLQDSLIEKKVLCMMLQDNLLLS